MMTNTLSLYYHTLRHLRPAQIVGRALRQLPRRGVRPAPAPPLRQPVAGFVQPARRRASLAGPASLCFLNETRHLETAADWDNPGWDKLWRYNLHYFDDLNAGGAAERRDWQRALLKRWLEENPPWRGSAFEPYPTSLRVVNWIKWRLAGNALPEGGLPSLAAQVRHLRRNLEFHLLGNHLFANAKALVFAGLFFDGAEADAWRETGLALIERELREQILPDGGHFERSPMYHALALEDLLDLLNLARCYAASSTGPLARAAAGWRETVAAMRAWLAAMSHPDGRIAFFNDAAHGIAPDNAELERYAGELGFPGLPALADGVHPLAASGYIRVQRGGLAAILDVAPIGPDYLPGHAHADTLSFELSWQGRRVVVNRGTSRYGLGPVRLAERGTAAHSTVEVDGQDSSEVWGGFRVARRARPFGLSVDSGGAEWLVSCSHDGYRRLPGRPTHRRVWRFGENRLRVDDAVSGPHRQATAWFHFPPACMPALEESEGRVGPGIRLRLETGAGRLVDGCYAPEFGLSLPQRSLAVAMVDGRCTTTLEFGSHEHPIFHR